MYLISMSFNLLFTWRPQLAWQFRQQYTAKKCNELLSAYLLKMATSKGLAATNKQLYVAMGLFPKL